ncbi:MAG: polysaccharide deacetylase family protein, partial [Syntrophothermus sp.]
PHSAFSSVHKMPVEGGLIDGPVYSTIFGMLKGLTLTKPDEYEEFQPGRIVYHDDWGDYATNEPTMDGTASLAYFLSGLQADGRKKVSATGRFEYDAGGIIRTDRRIKEIRLVFTGHNFAEGADTILNALKRNNVKASFFFTGDFYRDKRFEKIIQRIKDEGHYLGCHSDKHLLYASWTARDSLLVTKEEFTADLENNFKELEKLGIRKSEASFFLPPFEWHNNKIAEWTRDMGLTLVNFTPGTRSNGDYTTPDMGKRYYSSQNIYESILNYERAYMSGLNGFILLTHIGTDPSRKDKFYNKLDALITELKGKGYLFKRF